MWGTIDTFLKRVPLCTMRHPQKIECWVDARDEILPARHSEDHHNASFREWQDTNLTQGNE